MKNLKEIHEMSKKHDEILERLRNNPSAYNFIMRETLLRMFKLDDTKKMFIMMDEYMQAIEDYLDSQ